MAMVDEIIVGTWKEKHKHVIENFLSEMNTQSNRYILKGGTSLMECYGLNRFSEDIDLDSTDKNSIFKIIDDFCKKNDYSFRIAKNTDTVKRFFINYGGINDFGDKPLKIEISYRKKVIPSEECIKINGINVYNINNIALMKANAYSARDKIRDLFDITFIVNNYFDELETFVKLSLQNALAEKGIEQLEYLLDTQKDDLIDDNLLVEEFLKTFDKLDLLNSHDLDENIENISNSKNKYDGFDPADDYDDGFDPADD